MTDESSGASTPPPPAGSGDPDPARTGPAWEQPGPWFARFAQTAQALLLGPTQFFRTMRRQGGIGGALTFGILGSVLGGVVNALYQLLLSTSMASFRSAEAARTEALIGMFSTGCVVIVLPFAAVLGMLVGSAIYHLMLLLLGAARRPFETTLRVSAYSSGATSVLNLVPICGAIVAGIYSLVATIIGLAQAHEIPTSRAAVAVLLPILACCVVVALFYGALIALFLGAVAAGVQSQ